MLSLLALLALQSSPGLPERIDRLIRVAGGPGTRDNPSAVVTGAGTAVVWEELRDGRYRLMLGRIDAQGKAGEPRVLVDKWGHQWGPSVAARGDTTWLAYYMADISLLTGDRDIMLLRFSGLFDRPLDTIRVTRDPLGSPRPRNDASPALMLAGRSPPFVVWSRGDYHAERETVRAHDDKDILGAELRDSLPARRRLTRSGDGGEEMSPAIALWPSIRGNRILLAFLRKEPGGGPYALTIAEFDPTWRLRSRRVIARSREGIARPSLLVLDGVPYVSWVDNATTDVTIARFGRSLRTSERVSLRKLLETTDFSSYGPALASLSGAQLVDDGGSLALTFVATMEYQPAEGRVRQEVFLARFR
jgi:hypothetical protein